MADNASKTYRFVWGLLIITAVFFVTPVSYATEYSSVNYRISDSAFGVGSGMDSSSFSITGFISHLLFGSYTSSLIPLVPGTITSCGKINTPGTYTLNVDVSIISGTCFTIATSSVTIDGNGHTVTAIPGNTSYAVTATSSTVGGSGYTSLAIQNITFTGFFGGVNANGNFGQFTGGNGGSIFISSSTLGIVTANGGASSNGNGGTGGSVSITGIDLDFVGKVPTVSGGSAPFPGSTGSLTVNGSMLVSTGQVWVTNDSAWLGSRTWRFQGTAYNIGTVTGTTTFADASYNTGTVVGDEILAAYTTDGLGTVSISGNPTVRGTGTVTGGVVFDSTGQPITTWDLSNSSILVGKVVGNAIFHDTSYNAGTITLVSTFNDSSYNAGTTTNAVFTATSYNSIGGIPNGDPTGLSNGHRVMSSVTFSATSSVIFSIGTGATWGSDTSSWIFSTPGQNWNFSFGTNSGALSGDAVFTNAINGGVVYGKSTFHTNSYNSGTLTRVSFYDNTYNVGTAAYANFYNISANSHGASAGTVTTRCDFYDSSSPGIGHCPNGATTYHIPYYYNNSVSNSWDDLGNWWFDASSTQHVTALPMTGDTIYIGARMDVGPSEAIALGSISVAAPITGGGSFSTNFTNASGPAYFYESSTNTGVVDGTFHIYGDRAFSQVNFGSYTGDVVFHNTSRNDSFLIHNAVFYDTSSNISGASIAGNVEFAGTNSNEGMISGTAVVDTGASLSGNGTIQGNVSSAGTITGGTLNGVVINSSGAVIDGSVTNTLPMIFNGGSYVSNSGTLSGDAQFNATSSNRGVISATSTFYDSSYNIGVSSKAIFVGEFSENSHNSTNGVVLSSKSRLYTSSAPQTNPFRNFIDSAWTIVADGTSVKLLYGNLIDIVGRSSTTTTTLVERNGGSILRPLSATAPITSCGVLDTASSTYTLSSNILNYTQDVCFIVRAHGVTIDGAGHSVSAQSSTTSIYAVIATSTLSIDATPDAFSSLSIKNIVFNNFAHGLYGRGADVPNGIGGDGASTTVYRTTISDIDVRGGDPTEQAGHGGNVYLETSTTTIIIADGGDSTACGIGGNGGNIFITTDSVVISYSNAGGQVSGCPINQTPRSGSSGSIITTIISAATQAAQNAANSAAQSTNARASLGSFSPYNFIGLSIPVNKLSLVTFRKLPIFGTNKGQFSLGEGIADFLFAVLPESFTHKFTKPLLDLFASSGFIQARDIATLKNGPLAITDGEKTPGYYVVKANGIALQSYIAYDEKNTVTELIRTTPRTYLTVNVIPTNNDSIKATFNGKSINFIGTSASIMTPSTRGKYMLETSASSLTLTVEVSSNISTTDSYVPKVTSFFGKVWNWFKRLF